MFSALFRSFICVALAAGPAVVLAQEAPTTPRGRAATPPLTGRVVDAASGEALPGSSVLFDDLKQGTATGADGSFSFANLPRGRFTVQVRSLGYNTVAQTVDTGSGQPLEFKLTVAATEIGQGWSRAYRRPRSCGARRCPRPWSTARA